MYMKEVNRPKFSRNGMLRILTGPYLGISDTVLRAARKELKLYCHVFQDWSLKFRYPLNFGRSVLEFFDFNGIINSSLLSAQVAVRA